MAYKISDACINCGSCVGACPVSCIEQKEEKCEINPELCISCGSCAGVCPVSAPNEE